MSAWRFTSLGRMSLQPPAKIEPLQTAKELGFLAHAACETELTRAETQRKADYEHYARLMGTYVGDGDFAGAANGMPGMAGMPGIPLAAPAKSPSPT